MDLLRFNEDFVYFPEGFPRPGADRKWVEEKLGWDLYSLQRGKCTSCNEPLEVGPIDIHEALVTKGQVRGWPGPWKIIIINRYNCVLVHRACHEHGDRESVWVHKCELFGEDEIIKWYDSLPFRSPLPYI